MPLPGALFDHHRPVFLDEYGSQEGPKHREVLWIPPRVFLGGFQLAEVLHFSTFPKMSPGLVAVSRKL